MGGAHKWKFVIKIVGEITIFSHPSNPKTGGTHGSAARFVFGWKEKALRR